MSVENVLTLGSALGRQTSCWSEKCLAGGSFMLLVYKDRVIEVQCRSLYPLSVK